MNITNIYSKKILFKKKPKMFLTKRETNNNIFNSIININLIRNYHSKL